MSREVVVVGAGVVGLFSALYARRAGFEVTVVDREGPERDTTSYGNIGLVVPSHFVPLAAPGVVAQGLKWMLRPESPFYVRPSADPELLSWGWRFWRASTPARARRAGPLLRDLHRVSKQEYLELSDRLGDPFDLTQTGLVMLCTTPEGLEAEAAVAGKAAYLGMPARVLAADEVAELQPGVTLDVVGGVYYPEDARLDPGKLMRSLQAELLAEGVRFRWYTDVLGLVQNGGAVRGVRVAAARAAAGSGNPARGGLEAAGAAQEPAGTASSGAATAPEVAGRLSEEDAIAADQVVLAAGVWSDGLARSLGLRMPMRSGKGYSLTLSDPPETPSTPAILSEGHVALSPMAGGVRIGGTMEISGIREGISRSRIRGITRSVRRALPAFQEDVFADAAPWYGFRPCSPDGLPYLGRSTRSKNLVVATGHAMMGVSLAAVTGKLVGEILDGRPTSLAIEALSPDRYS